VSAVATQPRSRRRKTSRAVRIADRFAGLGIRLAGLGTIGAVSLVCVFLLWVAAPLFRSQHVELADEQTPAAMPSPANRFGIDEYESIAWIYGAGQVRVFDLERGNTLGEYRPFGDRKPTAYAIDPIRSTAAFGFSDGSVRLATFLFTSSFVDVAAAPPAAAALAIGERMMADTGGVAERISADRLRVVFMSLDVEESFALGEDGPGASPVVLLGQASGSAGPTLAGLTADCRLWLRRVYKRANWMTGEESIELTGGNVTIERCRSDGAPDHLLLAGTGDNVYLLWRSGTLARIDARDLSAPRLAEQLDVVEDADAEVTAAELLNGRKTLVVGDSAGDLRTWFRVKPEGATTIDGSLLVPAKRIALGGAAVTAIAPSSRSRMVAAGFADGSIRVIHVTSGKLVGASDASAPHEAIAAIAFAPKETSVFALGSHVSKWRITPGHPEVSFTTLFRPVWYEGYAAPAHVWQSSSGTDDFEPKLGLVPLVFGTLKATFYSMLFGAPLALLAAIYTSEFLHPQAKARVKPMIELMASLPSVVLGFLAAIIFAPLIEGVVPQVFTAAVAVPLVVLLAAHVFQALRRRSSGRLAEWRLPLACACIPIGVLVGFALGGVVEEMLFAGDFKLWLDGKTGSAVGAWAFFLLPAVALAVTVVSGRLAPRIAASSARAASRPRLLLLARFVLGAAATLVLTLGAAAALSSLGADPRGSLLGTYVQRNAMVVGFVMGFAIVPIIYTISEDALSSVPEHLRAGSLALGATRWQTAVRIVVPTAMSGLFSALMVGLGRAVGETMIVLMAAGNTPVMDLNIFNGFRTLSANIAVELPEAVRNSTHYRTLFLAALVLFAMTFTLNTVAEIVRLRFRKRAYQL
jgi:phosphate transport system permease protein